VNYRLESQPKYKIGQTVVVVVETKDEKSGLKFKNKVEGKISLIKASGDSEQDTYEYGITTDMPGCYHTGKRPFDHVFEDYIVLKGD